MAEIFMISLLEIKSWWNMKKLYDVIRKDATWQEDDYTAGCVLDYQYFKDIIN